MGSLHKDYKEKLYYQKMPGLVLTINRWAPLKKF